MIADPQPKSAPSVTLERSLCLSCMVGARPSIPRSWTAPHVVRMYFDLKSVDTFWFKKKRSIEPHVACAVFVACRLGNGRFVHVRESCANCYWVNACTADGCPRTCVIVCDEVSPQRASAQILLVMRVGFPGGHRPVRDCMVQYVDLQNRTCGTLDFHIYIYIHTHVQNQIFNN